MATVLVPTEPTDECCEKPPPPPPPPLERDPVLLLASGEMPEHRRLDSRPMESWRSLSRSRNAWLNSTVCVGRLLSDCCGLKPYVCVCVFYFILFL